MGRIAVVGSFVRVDNNNNSCCSSVWSTIGDAVACFDEWTQLFVEGNIKPKSLET
jgi:hypothetical protein